MTADEVRSAIDGVNDSKVGWLTTIRPDGSPHTTPVWFVFRDPVFAIVSAASNVKVRNIRGDARVSIAIDGSAAAPLVAQGTAELVPMAGVHAREFSEKYDGWNIADESVDGPRAVIQVRVDRWLLRG